MKRIIVSVTNDLTTDQRVHKICTSLQKMGFSVLLVGRKLSHSKPINRNYKTHRIDLFFTKGFFFYAEYNIRLFFYLLFKKKTIFLANDLDTLLANYLVGKIQGKKLVYDSHELFTEVPELIHRKNIQNVWLKIEGWILPKVKNAYTVCQSIADHYKAKYKVNFKVIRNAPHLYSEKKTEPYSFPFKTADKKIILYQGALNIGRGLELMIDTMEYLENYLFVIIGDGDIKKMLEDKVVDQNLTEKVKFLGRIDPENLIHITPAADLGISIEEDMGLNYHYALPNKLFDYIHANVPVLVSDLPEMKAIVKKFQVGEIIIERTPKKLANQIENLLGSDLKKMRQNTKKAAVELQWKNEETALFELFNNLK